MAMPRHDDIDAVVGREARPLIAAPLALWREVRHHYLPIRLRLRHGVVHPRDIRLPQALEPVGALLRGDRAHEAAGGLGVRGVVVAGAQVVALLRVRQPSVPDVRVDEVVVDREVWIVDLGLVVQRGRHPAVRARRALHPRVVDGLVPATHEHEAAKVVVPEHTKPLLAVDAGSRVDVLEHFLPLAGGIGRGTWRRAALDVDAAPVEIVADVQDVVGRVGGRPGAHLAGHVALRAVVGAPDEVSLVAGELRRAVVRRGGRRHRGVPPERAWKPSPVADEVDVVVLVLRLRWRHEAGVWQLHAVVLRRHARHGGDLEARRALGALVWLP
mmetsp:Transcript_91885/g.239534  ORF Transcript_91885/g.239534 Transcript_91885/m.239534 type:complete len:328 (-) Transcript_91885:346-1329(-)